MKCQWLGFYFFHETIKKKNYKINNTNHQITIYTFVIIVVTRDAMSNISLDQYKTIISQRDISLHC